MHVLSYGYNITMLLIGLISFNLLQKAIKPKNYKGPAILFYIYTWDIKCRHPTMSFYLL